MIGKGPSRIGSNLFFDRMFWKTRSLTLNSCLVWQEFAAMRRLSIGACLFCVNVRMSATSGTLRNMSLLKTRAPGEQFPRVVIGLQRRACMADAGASSIKFSASGFVVGGLSLISV